jgi:hypothetical protein
MVGRNNEYLELAAGRLIRGNSYKDLSTVAIIPTRGMIPAKIVQSWMALSSPMNQKFTRLFIEKMEVGEAYNAGVELVLSHPELSKWKYILTVEEDNAPPPDGLLKLYEGMSQFDAVSGLYWVKGEYGQPMIYGDPTIFPRNFVPQLPKVDGLQECNGIGMGFALWKVDLFKRTQRPWFRTLQTGTASATQDLFFCSEAAKVGAKFAVDTRVRVGHWDQNTETMW